MASLKKSATKTDRANGHCPKSSKEKKEVEPALSHIIDAIKTIVHCSKDEDFRRQCFATFQVENFNDFSQALSTKLRTIATRRYGSLSDSLQEKELNVNNNNNSVRMEKRDCNFRDLELLDEQSLYEIPTVNPMDSQSTPRNAYVTDGHEMTIENQDLLLGFASAFGWNTSKAESKNHSPGENETINWTVQKGTTVLRPEGEFLTQSVSLVSPSTSSDKQFLKDINTMSKQTSFEIPGKNSEGVQDCETQSSKHKPHHFSKLDAERDWSFHSSWDDFWPNTKSSPCCHVTDEYPTVSSCKNPLSQNAHTHESVKQTREEEQCVPSAGNISTSATQHSSLNDTLDDFESLAKIF